MASCTLRKTVAEEQEESRNWRQAAESQLTEGTTEEVGVLMVLIFRTLGHHNHEETLKLGSVHGSPPARDALRNCCTSTVRRLLEAFPSFRG